MSRWQQRSYSFNRIFLVTDCNGTKLAPTLGMMNPQTREAKEIEIIYKEIQVLLRKATTLARERDELQKIVPTNMAKWYNVQRCINNKP